MQQEPIHTRIDPVTLGQIEKIMTTPYPHPLLTFEQKLAIWRSVPMIKLGCGMGYRERIKKGRA